MKIMKNIKEGQPVTLAQWELKKKINATFFFDEDGNEWYENQKLFQSDTLKIAYDSNNIIRMIESDISLIFPANLSVAEVKNTTANRRADNMGSWQYIDGNIVTREYSVDELREQAQKKKNELLAQATAMIDPLQDAVDLAMATESEADFLNQWKKYRILLNRVDVSDPAWPEVPQ